MDNELEMNLQSKQDQFDKDIAEVVFNRNDWMSPDEFGNYLKNEIKRIDEDIKNGDFSSFDKLSDEVQNELMSDWDDEMQLKYLSREPTMSQEEFYAQLDQIANGTFIEE